MKNNKKHHGQIIERVIRRNQFSISELARLTNVNRRSLYNWFSKPDLRPELIFKIGKAMKHDFSAEFPELFSSDEFFRAFRAEVLIKQFAVMQRNSSDYWESKYKDLLEKFHRTSRYPVN